MMDLLLVIPIVLPLLTAIVLLAFNRSLPVQRTIHTVISFVMLVLAMFLLLEIDRGGIRSTALGDWRAPFGIVIVADTFSAIMVVMNSVVNVAISLYSKGMINEERERYGYYPLLNTLAMGVNGAFLTGDIFNLYVWFEVLLMSSFVLTALGGRKGQLEGAIKYVTLNLLSSLFFLIAVGLLYGSVGTLNMADLAVRIPQLNDDAYMTILSIMFLVAFGIKAAVFPLFFWLPASYHTIPAPVAGLFAGLLTKVGVYAMMRVFTLIFVQNIEITHTIILAMAGFSMVVGVLGAARHYEINRILSFHIVSQIGYIILGVGFFTVGGIAAGIYYMMYHILAKTNLFLAGGVARKIFGSYDIRLMGGLYKKRPFYSILFLLSAFALAGVPPLAGFWAKFALIKAGIESEQYILSGIAALVSLLTLFSMTKIWSEAFWRGSEQKAEGEIPTVPANAPIVAMTFIAGAILVLTVGAGPVLELTTRAAEQLLNTQLYITAVLR